MSDDANSPPPTPKFDSDELRRRANGAKLITAMNELEKHWPNMVEIINHQARTIRTRYQAAIDQGFSEAQALHLSTQEWK